MVDLANKSTWIQAFCCADMMFITLLAALLIATRPKRGQKEQVLPVAAQHEIPQDIPQGLS